MAQEGSEFGKKIDTSLQISRADSGYLLKAEFENETQCDLGFV